MTVRYLTKTIAFFSKSSGVKTQEEVVKVVCSDMKIGHKYRYVVLGLINNMTEIGVIKKAPMGKRRFSFCFK